MPAQASKWPALSPRRRVVDMFRRSFRRGSPRQRMGPRPELQHVRWRNFGDDSDPIRIRTRHRRFFHRTWRLAAFADNGKGRPVTACGQWGARPSCRPRPPAADKLQVKPGTVSGTLRPDHAGHQFFVSGDVHVLAIGCERPSARGRSGSLSSGRRRSAPVLLCSPAGNPGSTDPDGFPAIRSNDRHVHFLTSSSS